MKRNKINLWSFILPLLKPTLYLLIISFFWSILYLDLYLKEKLNIYLILVYILVLLIQIIPSLILQINYYLFDKSTIFEIDNRSLSLIISRKGIEYIIKIDDVDRVRMIHAKNYDNVQRALMPWSPHYFYMICLKNDEEYIVTRLVVRKLENLLKCRIVYKRKWFPLISKYELSRAKNR